MRKQSGGPADPVEIRDDVLATQEPDGAWRAVIPRVRVVGRGAIEDEAVADARLRAAAQDYVRRTHPRPTKYGA